MRGCGGEKGPFFLRRFTEGSPGRGRRRRGEGGRQAGRPQAASTASAPGRARPGPAHRPVRSCPARRTEVLADTQRQRQVPTPFSLGREKASELQSSPVPPGRAAPAPAAANASAFNPVPLRLAPQMATARLRQLPALCRVCVYPVWEAPPAMRGKPRLGRSRQPPQRRHLPQRRRGRKRRAERAFEPLCHGRSSSSVAGGGGGALASVATAAPPRPERRGRSLRGRFAPPHPVKPCAAAALGFVARVLQRLQKFPGGGGRHGGGGGSGSSAVSPPPAPASPPPRPLRPPPPRPLTPLCFLGRFSDGDVDRDPGAAAQVRGGPAGARKRRGRGWALPLGCFEVCRPAEPSVLGCWREPGLAACRAAGRGEGNSWSAVRLPLLRAGGLAEFPLETSLV